MHKIEEFLETKKTNTRRTYGKILGYFSTFLEARDQSIEHATLQDAQEFLDSRNWGDATRYLATCAIRGFASFLDVNHPLMELKEDKPEPEPQRFLSEKKFEDLMVIQDTSRPKGKRDSAIMALMFDTGLRSAEVCSLRISDLDMERQSLITVRKMGKRGKSVFSSFTAALLASWLAVRKDIAGDHDHVFCGIKGKKPGSPLTPSGLRVILRNIGKRIGIKLSPHDFRRGHASCAHRRGAPQNIAMLQGNWKTQRTWARYTLHDLSAEDFRPYFPTNTMGESGWLFGMDVMVNSDVD